MQKRLISARQKFTVTAYKKNVNILLYCPIAAVQIREAKFLIARQREYVMSSIPHF